MPLRPTRKVGLPVYSGDDPEIKKLFDAIQERIEILDGLRGDALDSAVTWRDLNDGGVSIRVGRGVSSVGGGAVITDFPPSSEPSGPIGPAGQPTNLTTLEFWGAIQINWDSSLVNLQHTQIWRSTTDNLGGATHIADSTSAFRYMDFVGFAQTYYYWVRNVGTDGSTTAFNATAGTVGTVGQDPALVVATLQSRIGAALDVDANDHVTGITQFDDESGSIFLIVADVFAIIHPANPGETARIPFIVGLVDGVSQVGIDGDLSVDGTIRAASIVANSITAQQIAADTITANEIEADAITVIELDAASIYAADIELFAGGRIRQGMTAYDTGAGFWLGDDSGTTKFSIGDGVGHSLTWDGAVLRIRGDLQLKDYETGSVEFLTANTERLQTTTGFQTKKEFAITRTGDLSFSFEVHHANIGDPPLTTNAQWRIRQGGSVIAGPTNITTLSYVTVNQDVTLGSATQTITVELSAGLDTSFNPFTAFIRNCTVSALFHPQEGVVTD